MKKLDRIINESVGYLRAGGRRNQVVACMRAGMSRYPEIAERIGCDTRQVREVARQLRKSGLAENEYDNATGGVRVVLTEEGLKSELGK